MSKLADLQISAPRPRGVTLTVESVIALRPCGDWSRERLTAYAAGRESIPLVEVLRDESIPLDDRLWLGCALLPEVRWWCADRAVRIHAASALRSAGLHEHADRLAALPEIVDADSANAARAAARDAAWAARAAARDAAVDAAWAAWDAAAWAARDAAVDAAWAAWDAAAWAARDAERRVQLDALCRRAEVTP